MARILIAGAGHGGLSAAKFLAEAGHNVTIFEKQAEDAVGYDWTDIFCTEGLEEEGLYTPKEGTYTLASRMTVFSPSLKIGVNADIPLEECHEFLMERKDILRDLIAEARECNVEFSFETAVEGPIFDRGRVRGLKLKDMHTDETYDELADLVIDAAGVHSTLRSSLPPEAGINKDISQTDCFSVFRAFYNNTGKPCDRDPYEVYLYPLNQQGIAWIDQKEDYVDMLFGVFDQNSPERAQKIHDWLATFHPELGDKILRGGQLASIPVRRPLSRLVANGYAAVGDSGTMTIPVIGSGISNSLRAGKILAEVINRLPFNAQFTANELWDYQVQYMLKIGAEHASLDDMKKFLLTNDAEILDFLFDTKIMNSKAFLSGRHGRQILFTPAELAKDAYAGFPHVGSIARCGTAFMKSIALKQWAMAIPRTFNERLVLNWEKAYAKL